MLFTDLRHQEHRNVETITNFVKKSDDYFSNLILEHAKFLKETQPKDNPRDWVYKGFFKTFSLWEMATANKKDELVTVALKVQTDYKGNTKLV
jgi:hypothetical protein